MNNTTLQILSFPDFVKLMDGTKSARFVSLVYKAKGTGEIAQHTILLNVKRNRCLQVDLNNLKTKLPTLSGVEAQACQELIDSITETLTTGQNSQYTKAGYYEAQGNGNVQVGAENNRCYIRGYVVKKKVLVEGTYKKVKSSAKTIAKNALRKELKNTKVREYLVTPENFFSARHSGKTIEVNAATATLEHLLNVPAIPLVTEEKVSV